MIEKTLSILIVTCFLVSNVRAQRAIILEAENASEIYHGKVENEHKGHTGNGYVNLNNEVGGAILWDIALPESINGTLTVTFANGSEEARTMDVFLNNKKIIPDLYFSPNGDWENWQTMIFPLALNAQNNALQLVSTCSEGGPNIDHIQLNGNFPEQFSPIAQPDSYYCGINQSVLCQPLLNDSDFDGDKLQLLEVLPPLFGVVNSTTESTFIYQANNDFQGLDSVLYVISDGSLNDTGFVSIQVSEWDWSVAVVESTMERFTPQNFADWHYKAALFLEGFYRVYKRTGNEKYLKFIQDWADSKIDENGNYTKDIDRLDHMLPGVVYLRLYEETGLEKYKNTAESLCKILDDYPRTSDEGIWHMKKKVGQLWLDGLYMSMPLLCRYEKIIGNDGKYYQEAIHQFKTYYTHLADPETGLLFHAYDEDGSEDWAILPDNHSSEFWGRSIGWFCMALVEVLEVMPEDIEGRQDLVEMLDSIIGGLKQFQDEQTGLWYQVVNKGHLPDNWLETSCTMMYSFAMKRASEKGYTTNDFELTYQQGHAGVLTKISLGEDNLTYLKDICEGTGVSDYDYYINRARITNDFHGLGAFLIMNELIAYNNMGVGSETSIAPPQKMDTGNIFQVYPNPAANNVSISNTRTSNIPVQISVFNILGALVYTEQQNIDKTYDLSLDKFENGAYYLKLDNAFYKQTTKLIIAK